MRKKVKNQNKSIKCGKAAIIWNFLHGCLLMFALSIISAAITALADMIIPQIIRAAVDNAIGRNPPDFPDFIMGVVNYFGGFDYLGHNLWIMSLAIVTVALVKMIFQYTFRVANTTASEKLIKNMRDSLFAHIERLPFSWHMKNRTGDIIQRCTSDIDTIKNFVSEQLTSVFRIFILLVMSIIFMTSMNLPLTIIACLPMPIIIGYSLIFHRRIGKGFKECDENEGKLSAIAQENLTSVRVVRAFGREKYERDHFAEHNEYYTGLWIRLAKIMSRFWSTSDILSGIQIMLTVVFGAVFCTRDKMTAGEYIAFISYNSMLIWPIRQLGRMISEMSKAGVSIDRVRYIMESEPEKDRKNALCPAMNGDIAFEHVNFSYENCPQILHDINFTMKGGSTLGILGGTGSGKSTMMMLLDRLYDLPPENGKITIGGVDIADIAAEHLRRNIGMVLQEPYLFSRTIEENIGMAKEGITLSEIREAAKIACLDETVNNFNKGYDTFVGERGVTLSGGQKQRAAIARMLTQKTPIMIFDDSLSAVDTETDEKIRNSLSKHFENASVILISHRITTLSRADMIIVLEHGRIVEKGTHDELKNAGGIYQQIYQIQSGNAAE